MIPRVALFLSMVAAIATRFLQVQGQKKTFCYYSSTAMYRQGIGKFLPEDIDPDLCTHIIFAFVDIVNGRELKAADPNDLPSPGNKGVYARTLAIKEKNPNIRVLLAVGGWSIGSKPFIPMMATDYNRKAWVKNVVIYLRKYKFDGLDMDWEFPASRGSPPEDKFRFTILMRELQDAFKQDAQKTGKEKLILTLATAGGTYFINISYEPDKILHIPDYMLLMAYNYHGSWNKHTGHHSGLYPRQNQEGYQREFNQEWTINYWLKKGLPRERLIVGIATYGMSFTLANPAINGMHAPIIGGGDKGEYTTEVGILSYYEICERLNKGWTYVWHEDQKAPYAYRGNQWVGYDNVRSIEYKAKYIRDHNLAGAFIWSIEMDDVKGAACGEGQYPLLNAINRIIRPNYRSSSRGIAHVPRKVWVPPTQAPAPTPIHVAAPTHPPRHVLVQPTQAVPKLVQPTQAPPPWEQRTQAPKGPARTKKPDRSRQDRSYQSWASRTNKRAAQKCTDPGSFPDTADCHSYNVCLPGKEGEQPLQLRCPSGMGFDINKKTCNFVNGCW